MFKLKLNPEAQIEINKPVDEVKTFVENFNHWRKWSPWICQEPEAQTDIVGSVGEVGHQSFWDGERIGSGVMKITDNNLDQINYDLEIFKPWKSKSKVDIKFREIGNKTLVSWNMNGSLPIFMFPFKNMFQNMIMCDYERGLNMLKEYLETGEILSNSEIRGIKDHDSFYYLGKRSQCSIKEMPIQMGKDFASLEKLLSESEIPTPTGSGAIYHKYNFKDMTCDFSSIFTYKSEQSFSGLSSGFIPAHQSLNVIHSGSYNNLGNSWNTAIGFQRYKKLKINKSIAMYELYLNNPSEVSEKDLKTEIRIPVK